MNLGSSAIVIRPRTTAEVLDLGCRVTVSLALPLYLRIAAFIILPAYALLLCLHYLLDFSWLATWAFAFPLAVWLEGPFTVAASRLLFADRITARGALRLFFSRFWPYSWALVIDAIAAAFIIPWATGTYVTEATLLEQASFTDARTRSGALVRGRSVAPALIGFMAMRVGLLVVAELLGQGIVKEVFQLGEPFGSLWDDYGTPYSLLGLLLAAPVVGTTRFLHYLDTRTRADGWDIQVRFMSLVAREDDRARLQGRPA